MPLVSFEFGETDNGGHEHSRKCEGDPESYSDIVTPSAEDIARYEGLVTHSCVPNRHRPPHPAAVDAFR
jgi:hypothetical protein